jgi:hypothetical protein
MKTLEKARSSRSAARLSRSAPYGAVTSDDLFLHALLEFAHESDEKMRLCAVQLGRADSAARGLPPRMQGTVL